MANPNFGVTIRPEEIYNEGIQAQNDPQQRKDYFAKSLNVYTSSLKTYFNIDGDAVFMFTPTLLTQSSTTPSSASDNLGVPAALSNVNDFVMVFAGFTMLSLY